MRNYGGFQGRQWQSYAAPNQRRFIIIVVLYRGRGREPSDRVVIKSEKPGAVVVQTRRFCQNRFKFRKSRVTTNYFHVLCKTMG